MRNNRFLSGTVFNANDFLDSWTGLYTGDDGAVNLDVNTMLPYADQLPAPAIEQSILQSASTSITDLLNTAAQVYGVYLTGEQARQLQEENLRRMRSGQPLLNPQHYAPQVNFGLSTSVMNMLMLGGIGVAAVLLLKKK